MVNRRGRVQRHRLFPSEAPQKVRCDAVVRPAGGRKRGGCAA